ncbi:Putative ATPase subunit of terminase (gpP-like) [[Flavobacterium] thermophilum]|nr:Putative ATPase subunit of terminase (gpP-like) [[Flavobacterium] thermophilum]
MMPNHKDEIEKLSTAMKEAKSKRAYERYQAIYLHLQGYTKGEIATIIGRSKKTIYNYISCNKDFSIVRFCFPFIQVDFDRMRRALCRM